MAAPPLPPGHAAASPLAPGLPPPALPPPSAPLPARLLAYAERCAPADAALADALREAAQEARKLQSQAEDVAVLVDALAEAKAELVDTKSEKPQAAVAARPAPPSRRPPPPPRPVPTPRPAAELTGPLRLIGSQQLGGILSAVGAHTSHAATRFQWRRLVRSGPEAGYVIAGASNQTYAPEPLDVGLVLACTVFHPVHGSCDAWEETHVAAYATSSGRSTCRIEPISEEVIARAQELVSAASAPASVNSDPGVALQVRIVHVDSRGSSRDAPLDAPWQLVLLPHKVKLQRNGRTVFKASYKPDGVSVCGARGKGRSAARGMFLLLGCQTANPIAAVLAHSTALERNATILAIRRLAHAQGDSLAAIGPEDDWWVGAAKHAMSTSPVRSPAPAASASSSGVSAPPPPSPAAAPS